MSDVIEDRRIFIEFRAPQAEGERGRWEARHRDTLLHIAPTQALLVHQLRLSNRPRVGEPELVLLVVSKKDRWSAYRLASDGSVVSNFKDRVWFYALPEKERKQRRKPRITAPKKLPQR